MKKNINEWLDEYGESHKHPTNKIIHWICVPAIMVTLLGLLSLIKFNFSINEGAYKINIAGILIILAIIFYVRLSVSITLGMILFSGLCMQFINYLESNFNNSELFIGYITVFILAWIGQFIGHKIEGQKPSFFEDIQFLLIGPAWLLSFIYKKLGIKF